MSTQAFLGLGSNLGDRLTNLQSATDLLRKESDLEIAASSRVWETDPVGPPQPDYLNAVLEIDTDLSPRGLLGSCQHVEAALHRERAVRWGPRTIDIDILLFGDASIDEPDLTVPHPGLQERSFVVLPLMELAPDLVLPGGAELRSSVATGGARPFAPPLRITERP
ncbi:MAG: 2-amino-4-hydroxy-6-hydroxymethyldihydropteridine diphosphokinase [Actinomycetota bacterium]|nr:2-amino-4-hydroxy-6-hydroxymethyldihydropteridine diphosphokinase [Actinomycetota bacterium]